MTAPAKSLPALETNACSGNGVIALPSETGWNYVKCPGCVGCDYDTVSARMAASIPADPFARLPRVDDEEF